VLDILRCAQNTQKPTSSFIYYLLCNKAVGPATTTITTRTSVGRLSEAGNKPPTPRVSPGIRRGTKPHPGVTTDIKVDNHANNNIIYPVSLVCNHDCQKIKYLIIVCNRDSHFFLKTSKSQTTPGSLSGL